MEAPELSNADPLELVGVRSHPGFGDVKSLGDLFAGE